ncbi:hypothetical protein FA95DRAFT_1551794 [Auriscalpium vulgare]|uniref:Uncharacterized protein n=1 Tax=Auriscalpium vulgare TaxID=40419 RepID=A0ACB8SBM9_9AGAM|nr:hypothetical protein FA95DRAFT_1551794 [Auriscalpium vulgare]
MDSDKQPKKRAKRAPAPARVPSPDIASRTSVVSHAREEPQQNIPQPRDTDPRASIAQPYPPHYPIMNPPYSNGSPFTHTGSPYHHPATPGHLPHNGGGSPTAGPGMPGQNIAHPQYGYAMHHQSYPGFPHYQAAAYPQQMMMYAAPHRQSAGPDTPSQPSPAAVPSPAAASQQPAGKRKRKSMSENQARDADISDDEAGPSTGHANGGSTHGGSASQTAESKKRTKTQRACDSCRSRKIRCDVLADADPPVCQHCKQYGFECTFFLPIAETRFKKKKLEEEAAAAATADKTRLQSADRRGSSTPLGESYRTTDARVCGPTSEAHLLHSSATIPSRIYENYDARHHHTWEVGQAGDGLIQVMEPHTEEVQLALPKPVDMRIERDMIEKLVNAYFTEIAPILPVITQAEFLASPSPPPILLYSICLVAAARREVPQGVFDSIRYAVNSVLKGEDILSTASIVNVQSLLILCMVGDCHSQYVPNALSALWVRLGTAIRMAQDLGLHRAEAVKQNIDLRRRLWGACVISDRWVSLSFGHPYMIDVNDCDARLPSSGDPNDLYVDELVRLSVILGRVQKTIYSPSGLMTTNDEELQVLLTDIENWKKNLPESLQFRGTESSVHAGLLFLLYSCVSMIFWRVFMRISYSCPEHLKLALGIEQWSTLMELTGDAIDWLDHNDKLYDVWMMVAYAATSCALVQYHTWARRQDRDAALKLKKLRDCIRRWEKSLSPDHMSARRKTAEIIALLYEATQGPPLPVETPALNPTGGVVGKNPPLGSLAFERDLSRPGGGVFIAHGQAKKDEYGGLLPGTILPSNSDSEEDEDEADEALGGNRERASGSIVELTPLGNPGGALPANVNPALNEGASAPSGSVQVMNALDQSPAGMALEQLAMADNSWLQGLPGGMFDWGQWDEFFTRIGSNAGGFPQGAVPVLGAEGGVAGPGAQRPPASLPPQVPPAGASALGAGGAQTLRRGSGSGTNYAGYPSPAS